MATAIGTSETESSIDEYKCSLCLHFLRNPVLTKCGHKYCDTCIRTWLKNNKTCPLCNRNLNRFNTFPDNHTSRIIADMKLPCPNANRGCPQQSSAYEMEEHIQNCAYTNCEIIIHNELSLNLNSIQALSVEESLKQLLEQINYVKESCQRLFREMDHRFEIQNEDISKLRNSFQCMQIDQEARPSAPNQMLEQIEEKLNGLIQSQRQAQLRSSVVSRKVSEPYIWVITGMHSKILSSTVKMVDYNSPIFEMSGHEDWKLKLNACLSKTSSFGVFYISPFIRHLGYCIPYNGPIFFSFEAQIIITFVHPSTDTRKDWAYIYNQYGGSICNYILNKFGNIYKYLFQSTQSYIKVDDLINNGFVSNDQLIVKIEILTF